MPTVTERYFDEFWALYRVHGSYTTAWNALHNWALDDGAARSLRDPEQGWKSASGGAFEAVSQEIIIRSVTASELSNTVRVTRWGETPVSIREGILSELIWPKGQITHPERAESKVDVVAFLQQNHEPARVISVYSCKSSAAERYQQDLFWAEKLKARGIKFCFVTIDDGLIRYATHTGKDGHPYSVDC